MPCYHPMDGWKTPAGSVSLGKSRHADAQHLRLPCGNCIGCRLSRAQGWALRCHLENQQHRAAVFTTLTYDDANLPPELNYNHVQDFFKRLRTHCDRLIKKSSAPTLSSRLRFFASGEYGERFGRPHYHAIIFGLNHTAANLIEDKWGKGICHTRTADPASIAYTARYTQKKAGEHAEITWRNLGPIADADGVWQGDRYERIKITWRKDPLTGKYIPSLAPFIRMSRNPGIGSHAKQWPSSWRRYGVYQGQRIPVPRYLHQAWLDQATQLEKEELEHEKQIQALTRDTSTERLAAAEAKTYARLEVNASRRNYD